MKGYVYTTSEELLSAKVQLNTLLLANEIATDSYLSFFDHSAQFYYILWNEVIAPFMPIPQEIIIVPVQSDPIQEEPTQEKL